MGAHWNHQDLFPANTNKGTRSIHKDGPQSFLLWIMASPPHVPPITKNGSSPIDKMNEYKGGSFPSPIIPVLGLTLGGILPYALVRSNLVTVAAASSLHSNVVITSTLQSFGYIGLLFVGEFFLGVAARGTSAQAAFSPAAVAAENQQPFAIVRSNRIHQNHIESAMILIPSALAAAAASSANDNKYEDDAALWIKAYVISWVAFRVLYRLGYCYDDNPFWRITGTFASMVQSISCLRMWYTS
jgi:hypothetical protein